MMGRFKHTVLRAFPRLFATEPYLYRSASFGCPSSLLARLEQKTSRSARMHRSVMSLRGCCVSCCLPIICSSALRDRADGDCGMAGNGSMAVARGVGSAQPDVPAFLL